MTKPTDLPLEAPAARRLPVALVLTIVGLFLVGVGAGVVAAFAVKGLPSADKAWLYALPLLAFPIGLLALRKAWRLAAPPADASAYERRYWRMWMGVMALGAPVGALFALPLPGREGIDRFNPLTITSLPPAWAMALTLLMLAMFIAAIVLYHRTIDEQEERGYLWGSQVAYYFLTLFFPAWWVLERGQWLPALTLGIALGAVLFSFIIQAAVWAWFKFR